ncbi:ribbon-helix-helix domain-containing protein [Novosphingobium sp. KA1]|uniref:ribbon-helix-helix domain-containing protein n=1 Tax=Novosphingobium sp. (strain KA1) TaxID=164608 RepID=UPI001A8FA8B4|nr:ribbon-helix-helix domain-containing protein [Novosphingobium sp. KA1]QSR17348.1 hypothetical protein CA833_09155 [Novosphingobium sp. KA1]
MSRFANLADKAPLMPVASAEIVQSQSQAQAQAQASPPSRIGRKAISGYFSQEMSLAMHLCARRRGISLQDLMAEAFNDVLRKHGESPIGK